MIEVARQILRDVLQLDERVESFDANTPLLGSLPELDSMAVVSILTAVEEQYDVVIEDDEITADVFATVGSLADFLTTKLEA